MPPLSPLTEEAPLYTLNQPVFFIGFMGAGKTTVSRRVARMCGTSSVDMDMYLERFHDKKISEIFAEQGEAGFRELEREVLEELSLRDPQLISCGGGVILRPENRATLIERGFVVYLKVTADEAADRISDASTRPMFKNLENARTTNAVRIPLYEEVADVTIDTAGKTVSAIAREVMSALQEAGVLCQQPK